MWGNKMAFELQAEELKDVSQQYVVSITLPDEWPLTTYEDISDKFLTLLQESGLISAQFNMNLVDFTSFKVMEAAECEESITEDEIH